MKKLTLFQVDAFTDELFKGNSAAVCPLTKWLPAELLQKIASENNLAETAFIAPSNNGYDIRWFTPTVEVDLCGHATLASAYVLFNYLNYNSNTINFFSSHSGELKVTRKKDILYLDFPTDTFEKTLNDFEIEQCIGIPPLEVYKGKWDYMAVFENEKQITSLLPDYNKISLLKARGLIVTAKGKDVDFVSRFFAPQSGINEDPVTGSTHTTLIPYWSKKLRKTELKALQLSKRGGKLDCIYQGNRCLIGGNAKLYLSGEIEINE